MSTMLTRQSTLERLAVGAVAVHAIVAGIHGAAHFGAPVENTPGQWVFVITVITIMPLVGAALLLRGSRSGAWWLLIGMAGSFVFGLVNHLIVPGVDNVAQTPPGLWQSPFQVTAYVLPVIEAVGVWFGWMLIQRRGS
ncbi:MAG: hypothetical protein KJ065_05320 [Anaerolineae bacterium]|nr:hypothetical protein [Anaerolineae bacterium]